VDRAIEQIVSDHLTDVKFLEAIFRQVKETPQPYTRMEREKELARLQTQRRKWIEQYDKDRITKPEFEAKMDAIEKAKREVEARMPAAAPPPVDARAAVAGLVRWAVRFSKIASFEEKRSELRRAARRILVIDGAVPSFEVSGAFLGELSHTNSAQPSRRWRWRRCPSLRSESQRW
jgi:hypothetical protein